MWNVIDLVAAFVAALTTGAAAAALRQARKIEEERRVQSELEALQRTTLEEFAKRIEEHGDRVIVRLGGGIDITVTESDLNRMTKQMIRAMKSQARQTFSSSAPKLSKPPGSLLLALVATFCGKRTRERVFDPVIADMQFEVFEAIHEGRRARVCTAYVVGYVMFFTAALIKTGPGRLLMDLVSGIVPSLKKSEEEEQKRQQP